MTPDELQRPPACRRVRFAGRAADESCPDCGHMLLVHSRKDGTCALCEAIRSIRIELGLPPTLGGPIYADSSDQVVPRRQA